MSTAPDQAIAACLASAMGAPWVVGTTIRLGPVRPASDASSIPHAALFVLVTGGPPPVPYLGGSSAPNYWRPKVQVRVRSAPGDFENGQNLADAVGLALNKPDLSADGYIACLLQQSAPIYLGMDETDHHEWSLNVELWIVE